jgi:hypothetical protein
LVRKVRFGAYAVKHHIASSWSPTVVLPLSTLDHGPGMSAPSAGAALTALLGELGWKPEILARRLNAFAVLQGHRERVHPKTPYKWLRGEHPRAPWPALAAALLSGELGRTVGITDLGWRAGDVHAVSAISGLMLPWTVSGSLHAARVVTDAGNMDRRIFLTLLGSAASAPAHEWLIARPDTDTDTARFSGAPVTAGIVDDIDDIVSRLRRMDDQAGSGTLRRLVQAHLSHVAKSTRPGASAI